MKKCRYCGKNLNSGYEFCSSECENKYRTSTKKDNHKIKYFIMGVITGFLVMFYGILLNASSVIGAGIMLMGIDVTVLPFTTPETIEILGYQKSKIAGRICGLALITVGIWFEFFL